MDRSTGLPLLHATELVNSADGFVPHERQPEFLKQNFAVTTSSNTIARARPIPNPNLDTSLTLKHHYLGS